MLYSARIARQAPVMRGDIWQGSLTMPGHMTMYG